MIDYFAALQQPCRAWLDPAELKRKHQELTLTAHPDRKRSEQPGLNFAVINEAYRVLSDPKLRLRHLLNLEGHDPRANQPIPEELAQLFAEIGSFVQDVDGLLEKLKSKNSALSKSLLQPDILNAQQHSSELSDKLEKLYANALDELQRLDHLWDKQREQIINDLKNLYHRLAYLQRWMDVVRERQFQLSI